MVYPEKRSVIGIQNHSSQAETHNLMTMKEKNLFTLFSKKQKAYIHSTIGAWNVEAASEVLPDLKNVCLKCNEAWVLCDSPFLMKDLSRWFYCKIGWIGGTYVVF